MKMYGVKLWNTLPDDIKNFTSVNIFNKFLNPPPPITLVDYITL